MTKILSLNQGHDGSIAFVSDGRLVFSLESEKNSYPRNASLNGSAFVRALAMLDAKPDVVALSGWQEFDYWDAGYTGVDVSRSRFMTDVFADRAISTFYSATHERSHLMGAYGMSPFPQGQPVYALLWEGTIGAFYEIDENVNIRKIVSVLPHVGHKFEFLYHVIVPGSPARIGGVAGKLMALAAFGENRPPTEPESRFIAEVFEIPETKLLRKAAHAVSPFFDSGVESQAARDIARQFSDHVFGLFHEAALSFVREKRPLLISGGCGLNCEWNARWLESGLFSDVFVPPCCNDSGVSIGAAVDAQHHVSGRAKLAWDIYGGEPFRMNVNFGETEFEERELDYAWVAQRLAHDEVFVLVQGRCELGPRALGNRSIIASPLRAGMQDRLNAIKYRETYRPIAPVCLEDDVARWFRDGRPSPWMLFLQHVREDGIPGATHVNGTARVQTVNRTQNPRLYEILLRFRECTGVGVLCNTSLNFPGRGSINQASCLLRFARNREIACFIIDDRLYVKKA